MNSAILKLLGVSKAFNRQRVLDNISLEVNKGEIVAIVGPSGSGKSTLLKIIARQQALDAGEVLVDGKPILEYRSNKDYAKKIGILSQSLDLIDELSVLNNVLIGRMNEWGAFRSLYSLVIPQDKERATRALASLGIADKEKELVSNLSGGEKQRVAFARLLVQNPEIILADEPISSLDPVRAEDVLSTLVNLAKSNQITLVTTLHSVDYVRKYFTRAIGLSEGIIQFDLPVKDIADEMLSKLYQRKEDIHGEI